MPSFKPKEVVIILQKLGFIKKRQTGSHIIMYNSQLKRTIPVPIHPKDIKKGLLHGIIKQSDSTEEQFIKLK